MQLVSPLQYPHACPQACGVAEELLKTEFDAAHLIFNRFKSAIAYKPTLATVLSPDVRR
jgi:F-type H+-transporting ATPase subunit gamma